MDSREAHVALNLLEGVGPVRVRQLLEFFGEPPAILAASKSQLLNVRGIGEDTATAIADWEKSVDLAAELKRIADFGCHVITNFLCAGSGPLRLQVDILPFVGGAGDLGGELFEILDFFADAAEGVSIELFHACAMIKQKRPHTEPRPKHDANAAGADFPVPQRGAASVTDKPGEPQHDGIADKERPLGYRD